MAAFWIARVTVTDPEKFNTYVGLAPAAIRKHNGRYLARGGRFQHLEGESRERNVVIEFPSLEEAVACYNSPEYQAAKEKRQGAAIAEVVIVETLPAPL